MSTPAQDSTERVRSTFDAVADDYDQSGVPYFGPTAAGLVEALDPRPGERALDIGCGRGAVTLLLARSVLPTGRLEAIDLSPAMVAHTRALLDQERFVADVSTMDAADPDLLAGAFDVIASSLVVFFLPEPAAALTRWVTLLAPGGRIGITTMGEEHPASAEVNALFRPYLPPGMLDPKASGAQSPFASDAGTEALLTASGVVDVRTVTRRVPVVYGDVAGWQRFSMSTGQRAMWSFVPDEERAALVARAADVLAGAHDESGRISVWQDMRYTLGAAAR
ncbi:MAG: class I SAM-dependent methyltransferase [Ornithinibacter sp.]